MRATIREQRCESFVGALSEPCERIARAYSDLIVGDDVDTTEEVKELLERREDALHRGV